MPDQVQLPEFTSIEAVCPHCEEGFSIQLHDTSEVEGYGRVKGKGGVTFVNARGDTFTYTELPSIKFTLALADTTDNSVLPPLRP